MKKIVTVVIIAVLMATVTIQAAKSTLTHWTARIGYSGPDTFSQCVHNNLNQPDDFWVAVGLNANYDTYKWVNFNEAAYCQASWFYEAGIGCKTGRTCSFSTVPLCEYATNQYGYYQWGYFYSQAVPTQHYTYEWWIDTYYPGPYSYNILSLNPDASSTNGYTSDYFYLNSNPNNLLFLSSAPTGSYYYIETAAPPPARDYGGEY